MASSSSFCGLFTVLVLSLLCHFSVHLQLVSGSSSSFQNVTCGSVFKLMNTAYKVRLHSHDIKYGSGSGQQSVTGSELKEDSNSNWIVKGPNEKAPCTRGEAIPCGARVRLEHMDTGKNLHSHLFTSPLSSSQEISAYGENGEGDTGDIWHVICSANGKVWRRDQTIQLQHEDTSVFLSASGNTYGRPIIGQMEIAGVDLSDSSTYWQTMEGVFVHPDNFKAQMEAAGPGAGTAGAGVNSVKTEL